MYNQYFIHFFITAKAQNKKDFHIGLPLTLEYENWEDAKSFLESRGYKRVPELKNRPDNFYRTIEMPHGKLNIYATISSLTTEQRATEFIDDFSEFLG